MKKRIKITKKDIYIVISIIFIVLAVIALFWGAFNVDINAFFFENNNGTPVETSHHFTDTIYYYNIIFHVKSDGIVNDLINVGVKYNTINQANPLFLGYMPYMYLLPIFVFVLTLLPSMASYEKKPIFNKIKYLTAAFLIILSTVLIFIGSRNAETFLKGIIKAADPTNLIYLEKTEVTVVRYIYPDLTLIMMLVMSYFMIDLAFTKKDK